MRELIDIKVALAERVSVAFHQNAIPIASEFAINNLAAEDLAEVEIHVRSEPSFLAPAVWRIDRIVAGGVHHITLPDLRLDPGILARLTETVRGQVILTAMVGGAEVAVHREEIELLPPSHWGGVAASPELLAAFVRPNDPAIDVVLREAAAALARAGKATAIDGYRSKLKARAYEVAEAIWIAIAGHGITYVLPPASFERIGQKVRSPGDILDRRVATCLDLSLLYAACAEQAGLNPLLVLVAGHAFVGVWLKDEEFSVAVVDDVQILRKRRSLDDLVFVETTLLANQPPARFAAAVASGIDHVREEAELRFELAIDVRRARTRQIRPLDLGGDRPAGPDGPIAPDLPPPDFDEPPILAEEIVVAEPAVDERLGRLETWKRRLLDLSLRNKLLNFKDAKKAIELECPDPAGLEDLLSSGTRFKLLARSDVLGAEDQRSAELFADRHQDDGRRRYLLDALARGDLHTRVAEKELGGRLTELFRLSRTAFEEGGANILFLALGFLRWTQTERGQVCRAPLLLVPVSLQRSSVRADFRLAMHEDEARFNPTLLELLRQDFHLRMPEFDGDLPTDQSGIDVARIWRIVRTHVQDLKGWEVTENVVLSTFSFTKYLMWKDLNDRADLLKRNPVVRHLIDTPKHSFGDGTEFPDPGRLDHDYRPTEIFAPLSADSSQLAAVLAAQAGKDFVLFGPPGTGKSQTIANAIAQCLAYGKTVLFVSQKTAALEVVRRRLNDIGLGDYCLEVHSSKAQKSQVLGQLRAAWFERRAAGVNDWEAATSELWTLRNELNGLVTALHARRSNGLSAYEAFGRVVANRDRYPSIQLSWPDHVDHSPSTVTDLRALCRRLRNAIQALGGVSVHPLAGVRATEWSPQWRSEMQAAIAELVAGLPALESAMADFMSSLFGVSTAIDFPTLHTAVALAQHLTKPAARGGHAFLTDQGGALRRAIYDLRSMQETAQSKRRRLTGRYQDAILDHDPRRLLEEWTAAKNANFISRGGKQKSFRARLQNFADGPVPADPGDDLFILVEIADLDRDARRFAPAFERYGIRWRGLNTPIEQLDAYVGWAFEFGRICEHAPPSVRPDLPGVRERAVSLLTETPETFDVGGKGHGSCTALQAAAGHAFSAIERLGRLVSAPDPSKPPELGSAWIQASVETALRWRDNLQQAPAWTSWQSAIAEARTAGLGTLVVALERGEIGHEDLDRAFDVAYARWWIDRIVTEDPTLRRFLVTHHENTVERFREADARVSELAKQIVRAHLHVGGQVPPPTAFGSDPEWGTLARELVRGTKHMPLRKLFAQIPTALTRLTPCVMMSPLSIAQYLPAEADPFDVILFDEASQIPVWDAIGAMARGRQVIVVGDPEQLPPTSVGERGVDEVEDGTDVTDQESILDECLAANLPSRRLQWHYRSRHESLIAFSNHAYYRDRLVTFPSPVTSDTAVRYVHVPGGVYERGTARVNREEARAVTADVVRRLMRGDFATDRRSLGIVTFNGEQQRLIENLLDQERRTNPCIERFFDPTQWHEPIFVKNLENVQGDERDIILFSVAVGPDEAGRVSATVSSLNRDGGHRRLNVAITRARHEMVVFATLRPEQIDLSRTNARGVRDFKHFLEYAERGPRAIAEAFAPTGLSTESPFEDAVKAALEGKGWVVHPQVGVSAFRVDLGIVHPDAAGRYLAGIECDGATYHRSATTRDRDRLRELVLTDLGWNIRRVWSTDWWQDADTALERLDQRLRHDLEQSRLRRCEEAASPEPDLEQVFTATESDSELPSAEAGAGDDPDTDAAAPLPDPMPAPVAEPRISLVDGHSIYVVANLADCGLPLEPERLHDPLYRRTLRALVSHVIAVEGPLFEGVLVRRLARAHGFTRIGERIEAAVLKSVDSRFPCSDESSQAIYWPEGSDPSILAPYRRSPAGERVHGEIPLVELASLARRYLEEGADREETLQLMAKELGLGRLRESARVRFLAAVERALVI